MQFRKFRPALIGFLTGLILGTYGCDTVLRGIEFTPHEAIPFAIVLGCIWGGIFALIGMLIAKFYR